MNNKYEDIGPTCYILLLLGLPLPARAQTRDFTLFKNKMEQKVTKIARKMEELYLLRCHASMAQCPYKSYNSCKGIDHKICSQHYPKPSACFRDASYISETSAIKFPSTVDYDKLSDREKSFVCTSAYLEDTFKQIEENRNKQFSLSYFGSNEGLFRLYPGEYHSVGGKCDSYDPRFRPWYTIAASGSKNVILLIDHAQKMKDQQKILIAREGAESILQSLSPNDGVAVISFNQEAASLDESTLREYTEARKQNFIDKVESLEPSGESNLQIALKASMELLKRSYALQNGVSCANAENIIFLFSDGHITQGESSPDELLQLVRSYGINIILIIISIGPNPNTPLLLALSCELSGFVTSLPHLYDQSEIATQLMEVSMFISANNRITRPIWTEPYVDFYGLGEMITVSMPAYYTNEENISVLLGVAGVDIVMSSFDKFKIENDIARFLVGETACFKNVLSECQYNNFREAGQICGAADCAIRNHKYDSFCIEYSPDIYSRPQTQDQNTCCGLLVAEFIIIITMAFLLVVIVLILFLNRQKFTRFCHKLKRHREKARSKSMQKHNNNQLPSQNKLTQQPPAPALQPPAPALQPPAPAAHI